MCVYVKKNNLKAVVNVVTLVCICVTALVCPFLCWLTLLTAVVTAL